MDTGSRYERDPRSGAQQIRDNTERQGTEQWDSPSSIEQGKWEDRRGKFFLRTFHISFGPSFVASALAPLSLALTNVLSLHR